MIGELGRSKAWAIAAIAAAVTWIGAPASQAGQCRQQSPAHRVSVLELYTSEGCNSCPPADRWFSALPQQGISLQTVVLLAFHVDYWNQLGWPDRFSQARFSQRQREVATRASRGVIYTPQLLLDGRDLRQDYSVEQLRSTLGAINREQAQAKIQAELSNSADILRIIAEVEVFAAARGQGVQTWIAAFENGLHSRVTAGENAGKLLQHDYVVRELAGPFSIGPDGRARLEHQIKLNRDWDAQHLGVGIFVERADSGEILEAAAMYPLCAS
jgi:hypothetical protein